MKRAVIYARFSSDGQRDVSIDDQLKAGREWADSHGYRVVDAYCDHAISGRTDERPEFRRMVNSLDTFDAVIIWNTDRFARNMFDSFRYLGDLMTAGKSLCSVTQPELNDDGPVRMLLYSIYSWKDQKYSEDLAKNVTRGMRGKAERCQYLGYRIFGYSHDGDTIIIDEEQAEWVRYAFHRYNAGDTLLQIAEAMKQAGIKTCAGTEPSYNFVDNMLHRECYKGVYTWKDVRIEGGMPRLVDDDEWEAAQRRHTKRRRRDRGHDYFLTGKLVCTQCGCYMHGASARGRGGKDHAYYCCKGKHSACRGTVRMSELNEAVIRTARAMFSDYDTCAEVVRQFMELQEQYPVGTDVKALEKRLKAIERKRRNIVNAIAEGLPMSDAKEPLASLEAEQEAIERRMEEVGRRNDFVTEDEAFEILDLVRRGNLSDEGILQTFVREVYLYPDKFAILTNFGTVVDGLLEVESALETKKLEPPERFEQIDDGGA